MTPETGPIRGTARFRRTERIRRSREFQSVSRRGERRAGRGFVVLAAESEVPSATRLGVTVSRRVGNAVVRNSVKRRIREWFRLVGRDALPGHDVVVIARPKAAGVSGSGVARELSELARQFEAEER